MAKGGATYKSWWLCLLALTLTACPDPKITSLNPNTGPERTLVQLKGDTLLSSVYFDTQQVPSHWFGAGLFTVPPGASQGVHQVQLKRGAKTGNKVPFTVTAPVPFGAPRLDRVSLMGTFFQPTNQVNTWLYVQGANVDSGAEVLINGSVVPTAAHKGIQQNDLFGVNPQDLNYPIYHYLAFIAAPGPYTAGTVLSVQLRNADGQLSNTVQYALPTDAAMLDSDGDDIPDVWEKNGYDADGIPPIDVDLPALGADPFRPDIFVEVDVMDFVTNKPGTDVWDAVRAAFANAPIINPRADNGINIVIDAPGTTWGLEAIYIAMTGVTDLPVFVNFFTIKDTYFDNAKRGRIFHYCIWANMHISGWSGRSDVDFDPVIGDFVGPGDDFIVSFDNFPASYQTSRSMAATFMHELGHNLQQRHGGVDHNQYTPVYSSVMSYSWQLRTGPLDDAWRRDHPIYAPFYYQQNAAVEINGAIPAGVTSVLPDYSAGMGRNLVENSLNEPLGLYNNPVDWNEDGDTIDVGVSRDLNGDGDTNDTLVDLANWTNLVFSGPRLNGAYGN